MKVDDSVPPCPVCCRWVCGDCGATFSNRALIRPHVQVCTSCLGPFGTFHPTQHRHMATWLKHVREAQSLFARYERERRLI